MRAVDQLEQPAMEGRGFTARANVPRSAEESLLAQVLDGYLRIAPAAQGLLQAARGRELGVGKYGWQQGGAGCDGEECAALHEH